MLDSFRPHLWRIFLCICGNVFIICGICGNMFSKYVQVGSNSGPQVPKILIFPLLISRGKIFGFSKSVVNLPTLTEPVLYFQYIIFNSFEPFSDFLWIPVLLLVLFNFQHPNNLLFFLLIFFFSSLWSFGFYICLVFCHLISCIRFLFFSFLVICLFVSYLLFNYYFPLLTLLVFLSPGWHFPLRNIFLPSLFSLFQNAAHHSMPLMYSRFWNTVIWDS